MVASPSSTPPLAGYDLREPSEEDAVAALQRVFGPERGAEHWTAACRGAGVRPGSLHSRAELQRAAASLAARGGAAEAVARSLEIRARTFDRLSALAARTSAGERP